jgi:hypothetical protein
MKAGRQPEEVFTPRTVVSPEMFTRRNEPDLQGNPGLQDSLQEALRERGGQVLIYGDTGVGKSSILKYAAEAEGMDFVSMECFSDRSYESLIEDCIRQLVEVREVKRTKGRAAASEVEATGGIAQLLTLKGRMKSERSSGKEFEVVQKAPIDVLLEAMMKAGKQLIVFDNFQNVDGERDRLLIAQTMELLSDRAQESGDKKIILIGIAEDARSLLAGSTSFSRRTSEVGVPRMPDDEIREILETGFSLLRLDPEPDALDRLVFYSDGFPYFTHLLGLQVARALRRRDDNRVTIPVVELALGPAASQVEESFRYRVGLASEAGGDVQPRKRILRLMANSPAREWRSADVVEEYAENYGRREDYAFLHVALAALTSEKHGSILRRTGTRGRFVYKFRDPHMRPYLRVTRFGED